MSWKASFDDVDKQNQLKNWSSWGTTKKKDFGRLLAAKRCSENNSSYDPSTLYNLS